MWCQGGTGEGLTEVWDISPTFTVHALEFGRSCPQTD